MALGSSAIACTNFSFATSPVCLQDEQPQMNRLENIVKQSLSLIELGLIATEGKNVAFL